MQPVVPSVGELWCGEVAVNREEWDGPWTLERMRELGITDAERSRANLRALLEEGAGKARLDGPNNRGAGEADELCQRAADKLSRGQPVSRAEAAAFLGVSKKTLQRMDAAGTLPRCPSLGSVVRYPARDVLRLASAQRKER